MRPVGFRSKEPAENPSLSLQAVDRWYCLYATLGLSFVFWEMRRMKEMISKDRSFWPHLILAVKTQCLFESYYSEKRFVVVSLWNPTRQNPNFCLTFLEKMERQVTCTTAAVGEQSTGIPVSVSRIPPWWERQGRARLPRCCTPRRGPYCCLRSLVRLWLGTVRERMVQKGHMLPGSHHQEWNAAPVCQQLIPILVPTWWTIPVCFGSPEHHGPGFSEPAWSTTEPGAKPLVTVGYESLLREAPLLPFDLELSWTKSGSCLRLLRHGASCLE